MKYVLVLLILTACNLQQPKFKIGDKVRFDRKDDLYYHCQDIAIIHGITYTIFGKVVYQIAPLPKNYLFSECPEYLQIFEEEVRPYFSILKPETFDGAI